MTTTVSRILVPVDFSAASRVALSGASQLASVLGASLELLHVLDLPPEQTLASEGYVPLPPAYREDARRAAEDHLRYWLETAPVPRDVRHELREGNPSVEIAGYAREHDIDLIVMGRHGRGGLAHLLGSVTDRVIRTAPCSVMIVHGDGPAS